MSLILNRYVLIFLTVTVAGLVAHHFFQLPFGTVDYFEHRGVFFLIAIALFPRLTLLFSSVASGGFLWWLGFIFCPRFLVACLATVTYLRTNPVLVTMSWAFAISGEGMEKFGLTRKTGNWRFHVGRVQPRFYAADHQSKGNADDAIEVDFKRRD